MEPFIVFLREHLDSVDIIVIRKYNSSTVCISSLGILSLNLSLSGKSRCSQRCVSRIFITSGCTLARS